MNCQSICAFTTPSLPLPTIEGSKYTASISSTSNTLYTTASTASSKKSKREKCHNVWRAICSKIHNTFHPDDRDEICVFTGEKM